MATITINTTAAHDARLAPAFGAYLGLTANTGEPRDATVAEVKTWLISNIKSVVYNYEAQAASESAISGVTTIDPT